MTFVPPTVFVPPPGSAPDYEGMGNWLNRSMNEIWRVNDDWDLFIPSAYGGLTLGNGGVVNRVHRIQGRALVQGQIVFGSTTSVSGPIWMNGALPLVSAGSLKGQYNPLSVAFFDSSANTWRFGSGFYDWALDRLNIVAVGATLGATVPFTWAIGDRILWHGEVRQNAKAQQVR